MADQQTGGMVALIPRAEDAATLAVRGGDKPDQLHLTLTYLGDEVSQMAPIDRSAIVAAAAQAAAGIGPVTASAMGHAIFNPNPANDEDRQPCAVYIISDSAVLSPLRNALAPYAASEQHEPFIPHLTAGFGIPAKRMTYTGPIVFDTLRIALGDQVLDFPLGDEAAIKSLMERGPRPLVARSDPYSEVKMFGYIALESKVTSANPNAVKLRQWWAHEGMKLWKGKFTNLVKALRKHTPIKNPKVLKGLAANIYHLALGQWPGRHDRKTAFDWVDMEFSEAKAAHGEQLDGSDMFAQYKAMIADIDDVLDEDEEGDGDVPEEDPGDVASADESLDGEGMDVSPEEAYVQGLAADIDWQVEGDGTLDDPNAPDDEELEELDDDYGPLSEAEESQLYEDAEVDDAPEESEGAPAEPDEEADRAALDELDDLLDLTENTDQTEEDEDAA